MNNISTIERYLSTKKGQVYIKSYMPKDNTIAQLFVIHGYGEHCNRYGFLAEFFAQNGFQVTIFDLPGHGHTYGRRCHINNFKHYLDVSRAVLDDVLKSDSQNLPLFIFAHSMGGLIAALLLEDEMPANLKATALTSPYLGCAIPLPKIIMKLAMIGGIICPIGFIKSPFSGKDVTQNPEIIKEYDSDKLMGRHTTFGWHRSSTLAQLEAIANVDKIKTPLFCWAADKDKLADYKVTQEFFGKLKCEHQFKLLENCYHEVLNEEPYRQCGLEAILEWFKKYLA